jgi:hypothetical protein
MRRITVRSRSLALATACILGLAVPVAVVARPPMQPTGDTPAPPVVHDPASQAKQPDGTSAVPPVAHETPAPQPAAPRVVTSGPPTQVSGPAERIKGVDGADRAGGRTDTGGKDGGDTAGGRSD